MTAKSRFKPLPRHHSFQQCGFFDPYIPTSKSPYEIIRSRLVLFLNGSQNLDVRLRPTSLLSWYRLKGTRNLQPIRHVTCLAELFEVKTSSFVYGTNFSGDVVNVLGRCSPRLRLKQLSTTKMFICLDNVLLHNVFIKSVGLVHENKEACQAPQQKLHADRLNGHGIGEAFFCDAHKSSERRSAYLAQGQKI